MDTATYFLLAADAVLLLHVFIVVFIVIGLVLILVGKACRWSWVRNPWFRVAHLIAIIVVVIQSWFGALCPLTSIENALRLRASGTVYSGTFISHWLEIILYYQAPPWIFVVAYTVFGALVIGCWYWVSPRRFKNTTNKF